MAQPTFVEDSTDWAEGPLRATSETLGGATVLPRVVDGASDLVVKQPEGPRFEGVKELGRGGLGVVLEARDRDIGRRVAIKQLRADRKSKQALLRFAEEVRTVGALDHPNIVPIHDVGVDAMGAPYFVMKHVRGQTLADIIATLKTGNAAAHAQWTFTRRMEVFRKVLEAVGFAHDKGIVHRDIKPENIMIGEHGEVHVLDWGIAQRSGAPEIRGEDSVVEARVTQTRAGALLGTPAYMSPEQSRGEPIDARSDIYSLGVVLHELMGLTHYLDGIDDLEGMLAGVQTKSTPMLVLASVKGQPTVPPHLFWMLAKAMSKKPSDRYATVAEWLDRIDGIGEGDIPVQCPFTMQRSMVSRVTRSMDRHPFVWTFLFLFGLGAAATVLVGASVTAFVVGALVV